MLEVLPQSFVLQVGEQQSLQLFYRNHVVDIGVQLKLQTLILGSLSGVFLSLSLLPLIPLIFGVCFQFIAECKGFGIFLVELEALQGAVSNGTLGALELGFRAFFFSRWSANETHLSGVVELEYFLLGESLRIDKRHGWLILLMLEGRQILHL